ncbi:MAG: TRAP transporter small permease [candidate division NC10 bacterium]|nr:TRAP transporter small permease [candidate division NC10 bacterium]
MLRDWSEKVIQALVVPGVLGLVGLGFVSICLRYFLRGEYALFWAEEVIRYGFIWVFWLVSPLIVRKGVAFGVDLLTQYLPTALQRILTLLGNLAIMVLLLVYLRQGLTMVWVNRTQLSTALEISMSWAYLAIPVGITGMLIEVAWQSLEQLRALLGPAPTRARSAG